MMKKFLIVFAALCGSIFGQNIQADSLSLNPFTVGTLPAASLNSGRIFAISDGTNSSDCTTGGGSTPVICQSNGTLYSSVGGTGVGPITDKGGQVYNVKGYGAVGNGSTNDFTAINSAITACAATGGIIYFPPGTYLSNSQLTIPGGCVYQGAGRWSTIIEAPTSSATLSPNTTFLISNNFGGVNCSGSSFTACPTDFGVFDLSIDARCGIPTGGITPCASGGRGTGTGNAVSFSGYRWWMQRVSILNAPNDCLYTEAIGGTNNPPYTAAGYSTDRNAAETYDVSCFSPNHNGKTDFGPPDSRHSNFISLYAGNQGLLVGCTAGGACGAQTYYRDAHIAHSTNNGCEIETFVLGSNIQCETSQTASTSYNLNIDEGPYVTGAGQNATCTGSGTPYSFCSGVGTGTGTGVASNFGQLSRGVLDLGNGLGNGLRINSPQSTNSSTYPLGNDIRTLKIWNNAGTGITCTASAVHTAVEGTVGGDGTELALNCPGQTFQISYAGSGTDVSINQWKGGNISSTVCGAEINSAFSPQAAITGNAADIILVNCSIPAWVNQTGHKCTYRMQFVHTGAASLTWKIWFGQTAAVGSAPSGGTNVLSFATTQAGGFFYNGEFAITNYIPPGGSTCSVAPCLLNEIDPLMSAAAASLIASSSQLYSGANQTLGAAFNLSLSFNVANTDTATFKGMEAVCY